MSIKTGLFVPENIPRKYILETWDQVWYFEAEHPKQRKYNQKSQDQIGNKDIVGKRTWKGELQARIEEGMRLIRKQALESMCFK